MLSLQSLLWYTTIAWAGTDNFMRKMVFWDEASLDTMSKSVRRSTYEGSSDDA